MQDPANDFRFASALSEHNQWQAAASAVCDEIKQKLRAPANLAMAFFSNDLAANAGEIASHIQKALAADVLLGCGGESIVGMGREVEWSSALSVWAASMPGAVFAPMHITFQSTPDGGSFLGWPDAVLETWPSDAALLMLADPFSFPSDYFLQRMNDDHPGTPVIGGMASGGAAPDESRLILGSQVQQRGAVAVRITGASVRTVVSQGCRPIGKPYVITRAERNVIFELGGAPALQRLQEVFNELPTREKMMLQKGLHVGRVVSEYQDRFEQGDFLVRNVVGVDPDKGVIAIGDFVRAGQTVQFHIRDESTADDEMRQLLAAHGSGAEAALLFTCNGRGTRLFSHPDHDARVIRDLLGDVPLAGFFAQGEMGPIGGRNFLHGFTASMALFGPK